MDVTGLTEQRHDHRRRQADPHAMLVLIATSGLRASTPSVSVELSDADAERVVALAAGHRLTGQLLHAIRSGELTMGDAGVEAAHAAHRRAVQRVLHLESALLRATDILTSAGIDVRVLKGPAIARTVYADTASRTFVDTDVLVRTAAFDDATAALAESGYRRGLPELRPGFDRRFGKSAMFVDTHGCHVDVHRTLVIGPHGLLIALDDLFASKQEIEIAGCALDTLGPAEQLLHVCFHAALGDVPPRAATLRDVAEMLVHAPADHDRVLALAERWRGRAVVARAVRLTCDLLELTIEHPLTSWARSYEPSPAEHRLLQSYTSNRRSNSWKYLASARVIDGWSAKAAFLGALLVPEHTFLERRASGWRAWWTHGAASLMRSSVRGVGSRDAGDIGRHGREARTTGWRE